MARISFCLCPLISSIVCTQGTKHSHRWTRLSSKDSLQTTLIEGLSSTYFNRIVGNMHKDTSVCVSLTHLRALSIEFVLYVAHEEDLRL